MAIQVGGTTVVDNSRNFIGVTAAVADGTAAAPSVLFSADTNTGLFRSTTDTLGFTTNGTSRLLLSTTALTTTVDLTLGNSVKVLLGASGQLSIWFDGTSSRMVSTAPLLVDADTTVRNAAGTKTAATFLAGGAQSLYYNNTLALSTSATGLTVPGTVALGGLTGIGRAQAVWDAGTATDESTITPEKLRAAYYNTLSTPDYTGTSTTWAVDSTVTFTHGLGVVPSRVRVVLVFKSGGTSGYTTGDEIEVTNDYAGSLRGIFVGANSTLLILPIRDSVFTSTRTGTSYVTVTNTYWDLKVRAWK